MTSYGIRPWWSDSTETASGISGAIQSFIDTEFFDSIGRVVKIEDDETTGRKCTTVHRVSRPSLVVLCEATGVPSGKVTKDNVAEFYKTTSNPMLNEAFFARCVILVEGDTEELTFPVFLEKRGIDCDLLGISVISVRGKNQVPKYWRLFRAFDIPTLAVVDNDDDENGEKRRSNTGLATCFGVGLETLLDVQLAKVVRRESAPTGVLIVLEGDYETSLAKDVELHLPGAGSKLKVWEAEARALIRPVGTQNKGQIARHIARKLLAGHPDYQPTFIDLIAGELLALGVVRPKPVDVPDEYDDSNMGDEIPF